MSYAAEPYGVFVDDLVSSLGGDVAHEHAISLGGERARRSGADARAATRDHNCPAHSDQSSFGEPRQPGPR